MAHHHERNAGGSPESIKNKRTTTPSSQAVERAPDLSGHRKRGNRHEPRRACGAHPEPQGDQTITHQTSLIEKQNNTIEVIRAEMADVKEEQQNLMRQNAELQEQVFSLQSQVSAITASFPPTRSWASVAGYPSRGGPAPLTQNATASTDNHDARRVLGPLATTDVLYCVVDTSRVAEEDTDKPHQARLGQPWKKRCEPRMDKTIGAAGQ